MRKSVIRLAVLGIFSSRCVPLALAALSLVCIGLPQTGADESLQETREAGNRTLHVMDYGYALPIEITTIRNLRGLRWLRDLEIELKNISSKPIYEVYLNLFLPDAKGNTGAPYGVGLQYGRLDLIHPS